MQIAVPVISTHAFFEVNDVIYSNSQIRDKEN